MKSMVRRLIISNQHNIYRRELTAVVDERRRRELRRPALLSDVRALQQQTRNEIAKQMTIKFADQANQIADQTNQIADLQRSTQMLVEQNQQMQQGQEQMQERCGRCMHC